MLQESYITEIAHYCKKLKKKSLIKSINQKLRF